MPFLHMFFFWITYRNKLLKRSLILYDKLLQTLDKKLYSFSMYCNNNYPRIPFSAPWVLMLVLQAYPRLPKQCRQDFYQLALTTGQFLAISTKCITIVVRPVPTVERRGVSHPLDKCSVGKSPNLPFLLAHVFTFMYFWNIRRRIRCCGVMESSLISYIYTWNLFM